MKIQHLIPILFLAAYCTVSAQTNNAPANTNRSFWLNKDEAKSFAIRMAYRNQPYFYANTNKPPSNKAFELIQVGKDMPWTQVGMNTTWTNGCILHIEKSDGIIIEGIRLVRKTTDGQDETVTSDFGIIEMSGPNDTDGVSLTMLDPEIQIGNKQVSAYRFNPYRVMLRK